MIYNSSQIVDFDKEMAECNSYVEQDQAEFENTCLGAVDLVKGGEDSDNIEMNPFFQMR